MYLLKVFWKLLLQLFETFGRQNDSFTSESSTTEQKEEGNNAEESINYSVEETCFPDGTATK